MSESKENSSLVSFKDTLNLPQTDFPIRPDSKQDDPAMLVRWEKEKLYEKAFFHNKGKQTFILHDGPPYANGNAVGTPHRVAAAEVEYVATAPQ